MPTSFPDHISYVIHHIRESKPKSVLDIGVGFGKWGMLCREYLDIYGKGDIWEKKDWKVRIDGVEIFKPYLDEFQHLNYIYNRIWNCSIQEFHFDHYDCVLIMDIAEHLSKDDAMKLFYHCFKHSNKVILSIPLGDNWLYNFKGENKYESHISSWTEQQLSTYMPFVNYYTDHKIYTIDKDRKIGVFIYQ